MTFDRTCLICFITLLSSLSLLACTPNTKEHPHNQSSDTPSVLTPDWGVASTLIALDGNLLATGDANSYPIWVGTPALPQNTIDLGLRFTPNSELIAHLYKTGTIDQVIDSDFYSQIRPQYKDTPLSSVDFYAQGNDAKWDNYATTTLQIGKLIGKEQQANAYIQNLQQKLKQLGTTLKKRHPKLQKIALVQFMDANTLRLYGDTSIFAPATKLLDIQLVTLGKTNPWGFSLLNLGELAQLDNNTCLLIIKPFGVVLQNDLQKSLIWQRLDFGGERCFGVLEPIWMYSGLMSMAQFAERLEEVQLHGKTM